MEYDYVTLPKDNYGYLDEDIIRAILKNLDRNGIERRIVRYDDMWEVEFKRIDKDGDSHIS